jgi:hypothetical protein
MSEAKNPQDAHEAEIDPSAELGLRNPVRDKAKLGDTQYSVTPPRAEVRAPQDSEAQVFCAACQTELEAGQSYRSDGQEYAYHFCGAECFGRWCSAGGGSDRPGDHPREPG